MVWRLWVSRSVPDQEECDMKIYMIRHGQTEWNRLYRFQGQTDIELNENGRELASRVGRGMADIPFTRVISSPLKRASETARLVLEAAGKDLEIATDPRLMEISFGIYEGYSTVNPDYPHPAPEFCYFFKDPEKYQAPEGGENFQQLIDRTGIFLSDLAAKTEWEQDVILLSVHGAALKALLANIKEDFDIAHFWGEGVPGNCSVSIAETEEGHWHLLAQDVMFDEEHGECPSFIELKRGVSVQTE